MPQVDINIAIVSGRPESITRTKNTVVKKLDHKYGNTRVNIVIRTCYRSSEVHETVEWADIVLGDNTSHNFDSNQNLLPASEFPVSRIALYYRRPYMNIHRVQYIIHWPYKAVNRVATRKTQVS